MKTARDHTAWLQGGEAVCRHPAARPAQARRLVLLGPPGIGKATQASLLAAALGACYLPVAEIFRATHPATPAGTAATAAGQTAPASDEALLDLITARLRCLTCSGGFILDGYPRSAKQAKALDVLLATYNLTLDAVILYDLPTSKVVPRLLGRRTCPSCQRVYHVKTRPPRVPGTCDDCQAKLVQSREDRLDSIRLLQHAYPLSPRSLIGYYHTRGLLMMVPAHGTPEEIFMRTIDAFRHTADHSQPPQDVAAPSALPG